MYEPLTKLQEIIEDSTKKQEEVANEIGVNSRQIRRWVRGDQEMGIWKLKAICQKLEVSADYILDIPKEYKNKRKDFTKPEKNKTEKDKGTKATIDKETVIDILLWAEEQEHIKGDINLIIQTINEE